MYPTTSYQALNPIYGNEKERMLSSTKQEICSAKESNPQHVKCYSFRPAAAAAAARDSCCKSSAMYEPQAVSMKHEGT
jgi:hypothetical protein